MWYKIDYLCNYYNVAIFLNIFTNDAPVTHSHRQDIDE